MCLYNVSDKNAHAVVFVLTLVNVDGFWSFIVRLKHELGSIIYGNLPPHLTFVATLPCKIRKFSLTLFTAKFFKSKMCKIIYLVLFSR